MNLNINAALVGFLFPTTMIIEETHRRRTALPAAIINRLSDFKSPFLKS